MASKKIPKNKNNNNMNNSSINHEQTENIVHGAENIKNSNDVKEISNRELSDNKILEIIASLKEKIHENIKNTKECKQMIKKLEVFHNNEINKNIKLKKKKKKKENKPTGFGKLCVVPDKLADLIGIEKGTKMSRPEFTKKFYNLISQKNLYYEGDKRILRVNNEISDALNIPKEVNESKDYKDPKGFNFYNIQKYIAKCYSEFAEKNMHLSCE